MAQNITLMGASYSAVPAVTLPKTGGGTASFTDVSDTTAAAGDVASGKYFYTSAGVRTQGTSSGGGGSSSWTLLATSATGSVNTSSTTATDLQKNVTVTGVQDYDLLVVEASVDTKTNGRHAATARLIWLTASTAIGTKDGTAIATATWNVKLASNGTATARSNTTPRGIYPYSCSLATSSGVTTATIVMYRCYNSTQTGTINGTYTTRVYGVKLYDLIGG